MQSHVAPHLLRPQHAATGPANVTHNQLPVETQKEGHQTPRDQTPSSKRPSHVEGGPLEGANSQLRRALRGLLIVFRISKISVDVTGPVVWTLKAATDALHCLGGRDSDLVNRFCILPRGAHQPFGDLLNSPLPCASFRIA